MPLYWCLSIVRKWNTLTKPDWSKSCNSCGRLKSNGTWRDVESWDALGVVWIWENQYSSQSHLLGFVLTVFQKACYSFLSRGFEGCKSTLGITNRSLFLVWSIFQSWKVASPGGLLRMVPGQIDCHHLWFVFYFIIVFDSFLLIALEWIRIPSHESPLPSPIEWELCRRSETQACEPRCRSVRMRL